MNLERDGMPDNEPRCQMEGGCFHGCDHLMCQEVDFDAAGKLPVYWCANPDWFERARDVELYSAAGVK